jgi:RIO kinase 2
MSRLAAIKEFAFMTALRENGFPVPEPIAQNRHTIVMSLVDAFPLRQILKVGNPARLYAELLDMILRLACYGLIHGDFNEFNILIKEESDPSAKGKAPEGAAEAEGDEGIRLVPILIDFPQMVSIDHVNAEMYFDRDVNCIKRYFQRRYGFTSDEPGPFFADAKKKFLKNPGKRLDVEVEASGFSRKMARELEAYMKEVGVDGDGGTSKHGEESDGDYDDDDDDDDDIDDYDGEKTDDGGEEDEEEGVVEVGGKSPRTKNKDVLVNDESSESVKPRAQGFDILPVSDTSL